MASNLPGSEFTRADDARIGRCIRAFGRLEYVLGSLLRCLYLLDQEGKGYNISRSEWGELRKRWQSIGLMAKGFGEEIASSADCSPHTRAVYDKLIKVLEETGRTRNAMVHGHWYVGSGENLRIEYWKTGALRNLDSIPAEQRKDPGNAIREICFDKDFLSAVTEYALQLADEMEALEMTVRKEAEKVGMTLPDIPLISREELW